MNLSPLSAAAPTQLAGTAAADTTDGAASGQPQDLFATLLQSGQSAAPVSTTEGAPDQVPAEGELALQDTMPAGIADTDEPLEVTDAPWPPPGLETLLGTPITPAPPVGVAAPVTGSAPDGGGAMPAVLVQTSPAPLAGPATVSTPIVLPGATTSAGGLVPADAMTDAGKPAIDGLASPSLQGSARAALAGIEQDLLPQPGNSTAGGTGFASLMSVTSPLGATASSSSLLPETPTTLNLQGEQAAQELGESVEWILDQKIQSARIRVSPDQMGTIDVEIRLDGDRVHAHFASAHADVRQVLNDSLPRLRELLGEHGMQLGQTDVASHSNDRSPDAPAAARADIGGGNNGDDASARLVTPLAPRGLLDTYA